MIAPQRTALLLIDIQNDFGHPQGRMGRYGVGMATVDGAVDAALRLADAARAVHIPVVIVTLETTALLDSRAASLRRDRLGVPNREEDRVCRKGTWGADLYRITAQDGDVRVAKPRYASFEGTELALQLRALAIDTLLVAGLTTECCVEAAVREAFQLDYHVFVAADACTSYDPMLHQVSIDVMRRYCAIIVESEAVIEAWQGV